MFISKIKAVIVMLVTLISFFGLTGVSFAASPTAESGQDLYSKEMQYDPVPLIWDGVKRQFTNVNPLSFDNLVSWMSIFLLLGLAILTWVWYHGKVKQDL